MEPEDIELEDTERNRKLAASGKTLLITGPTGAGKSRMAAWVHARSPRKNENFLHVNLCNFSSDVFESELFGHCRGAFTGAYADKKGFIETVDKGTLFLDELGELPLETQSKLLMLLEEGIYYPVGSPRPKRIGARLVFATNRDLGRMQERGEFRDDLYERLKTFEIRMAPLTEVASLADVVEDAFVLARARAGKPNLVASKELLERLISYEWPGNFRELKNAMEHICLMADTLARPEHLPPYFERGSGACRPNGYHESLQAFERSYLSRMLAERGGAVNKTAREIGVSKTTLLSKMKKYDIKGRSKNIIVGSA